MTEHQPPAPPSLGSTGQNTISRAELADALARRHLDKPREGAEFLARVLFDDIAAHRQPTPPVAAAFDREAVRERIGSALDASIDYCARCKTCGEQVAAVMGAVWPLLEHAQAALTGNEGVRLWMLDCGELVAKHRERAEAAEGKLADLQGIYDNCWRALWIMVRQFGGSVFLTAKQLDEVPQMGTLGYGREPDGLRINAEEEP